MQETFDVELRRAQGYRFDVTYPGKAYTLTADEVAPPGGDTAPNPARMLATAVGHCLSASLIFCLSKARVETGGIKTHVQGTLERNERGRWRIAGLNVTLDLAGADAAATARCRELFQDFCTVTESIRRGIPVDVTVRGT